MNDSIKKILLRSMIMIAILYGCSSGDFSTPEQNVESLYRAISEKNPELYVKCFYIDNEFKLKADDLRLAAEGIFKYIKVLKYRIIEKKEIAPNRIDLKIEEVGETYTKIKYMSTFIVKYIKVGKEWKALGSEKIETKKLD